MLRPGLTYAAAGCHPAAPRARPSRAIDPVSSLIRLHAIRNTTGHKAQWYPTAMMRPLSVARVWGVSDAKWQFAVIADALLRYGRRDRRLRPAGRILAPGLAEDATGQRRGLGAALHAEL